MQVHESQLEALTQAYQHLLNEHAQSAPVVCLLYTSACLGHGQGNPAVLKFYQSIHTLALTLPNKNSIQIWYVETGFQPPSVTIHQLKSQGFMRGERERLYIGTGPHSRFIKVQLDTQSDLFCATTELVHPQRLHVQLNRSP